MAHNFSFLLASSLVLSSLFAIASADGYGYTVPESTYTPSPSYKTPSPEYTPKAVYSPPPPTYKSHVYTPSPVYHTTPVYTPPPTYKSPVYTPSPVYHTTPIYTPKPSYTSYSKEKEMPTIYGIQGLIYCRYGYDLTPLKGATAKIACMAKGYKAASFSMVTEKTDKNGYFLATLTQKELGHLKPKNCKVYLNSSPSKSCNIATNIGKGISGAPLTYSRTIHNYMNMYNIELYSVSPFVYKSAEYKAHTSTYTPKSTYATPTYSPKSEYKAPSYTPKSTYSTPTYTPEVEYKAPTYSPKAEYKAPTYSHEVDYKAPTYSPEAEYSAPKMPKYTPAGY